MQQPLRSRRVRLALCWAIAAASGLSATAAGQSSARNQQYYFCQLTVRLPHSDNPTTYISPVFPVDGEQTKTPEARAKRMQISMAWDTYVINKFVPDQRDALQAGSVSPHCSPGNQGGLQDIHDRAIQGSAVEVVWKYTPNQVAVSPSAAASPSSAPPPTAKTPAEPMSAEIRRLIDYEATQLAPSVCKGGSLKNVYAHPGVTVDYDCTCFAEKVRAYRMDEYDRVGPEILGPVSTTGRKGLIPVFNGLFNRGNPTVDFRSCALSPARSDVADDEVIGARVALVVW